MTPNQSGRRLLLLVAVSIAFLVAGTAAAVACDTCADPNQDEDDEYEPFYSNEEFPYNTSENRSFVDIVVDETEQEMEEDLGGGDGVREARAGASAGTVSADTRATVDVPSTNATGGDARGSAAIDVAAVVGG